MQLFQSDAVHVYVLRPATAVQLSWAYVSYIADAI